MSEPLSPAQVAEIRARAENATPGPWENPGLAVSSLTFDSECNIIPPDTTETHGFQFGGPVAVVNWRGEGEKPDGADADFIAHARTDVPALCDSYDAQARKLEACESFNALRERLLMAQARRIAELEAPPRLVKVHIGTSALSRDLVWCECDRGLARSGKWEFCPSCGGRIDQSMQESMLEVAKERDEAKAEAKLALRTVDAFKTAAMYEVGKRSEAESELAALKQERDELRAALTKIRAEARLRAVHESHCESMKRANVPLSMCSCWVSQFLLFFDAARTAQQEGKPVESRIQGVKHERE